MKKKFRKIVYLFVVIFEMVSMTLFSGCLGDYSINYNSNNTENKDTNQEDESNNFDDNHQNSDDEDGDIVEITPQNEKEDIENYIIKLNKKLSSNEINLLDNSYVMLDELKQKDQELIESMSFVENLSSGWIKIEENKVNEYTFYYKDCYVSKIRYTEFVDPESDITKGYYESNSEVKKNYKYIEKFERAGGKTANIISNQTYNSMVFNEELNRYEYTGNVNIVNVEDFVEFADESDFLDTCNTKSSCLGCCDCLYDWTRCIQAAVDEILKTGGVLYFPTREYLVDLDDDSGLEYEILPDGTKSSFSFAHSKNNKGSGIRVVGNLLEYTEGTSPLGFAPIIIDLCGSKIKLEKNPVNYYNIIFIYNCRYVELKNGVMQGDRMEHNYSDYKYDGIKVSPHGGKAGNHTHGYGINMRTVKKGIISNMEVYDVTADGLRLNNSYANYTTGVTTSTETDIRVEYSFIHHCRRQGATIGDITNIEFYNTEISYIGGGNSIDENGNYVLDWGWFYPEDEQKYGSKLTEEEKINVGTLGVGRDPMAGVDLEPDKGIMQVEKSIFDNCYIHATDGFTIVGLGGGSASHHLTMNMEIKNSILDGVWGLNEEGSGEYNGVYYEAEDIKFTNSLLLISRPRVARGYELDSNLQATEGSATAMSIVGDMDYCNTILRVNYIGGFGVYINGSNFANCIIEDTYYADSEVGVTASNNFIQLTNKCDVTNSIFRNLCGAGVVTAAANYYGLRIKSQNDTGPALNINYGNIFDNCSIMFSGGYIEIGKKDNGSVLNIKDTSYFKKGIVYVQAMSTVREHIFNNVAFLECESGHNGGKIYLNYCTLLNVNGIFGDMSCEGSNDRRIENSYLHFSNESLLSQSFNFYRSGYWGNSILRVDGDVQIKTRSCISGEVAKPHFTILGYVDLSDEDITTISLNRKMGEQCSLLYRSSEGGISHTGSHNYKGLCYYDNEEWIDYVKNISEDGRDLRYLLAYNVMKNIKFILNKWH